MKGGVQVRLCGSGMLLGYQLAGLGKVIVLLEELLSVLMCFPSAPSPLSLLLLPVTAMEVLLICLVSDLKGLVEMSASLPGI